MHAAIQQILKFYTVRADHLCLFKTGRQKEGWLFSKGRFVARPAANFFGTLEIGLLNGWKYMPEPFPERCKFLQQIFSGGPFGV
jgi:hypothetical protein